MAFLMGILDDLKKGIELLDKLAKAWIEGDLGTIRALPSPKSERCA